jgi:flagellin
MGEIGMLNINTNYAASFASKAASSAQRGLDSAMEKLSSGSRINYAKDDAAGQAIATRITAEVQGLKMASRNASDAQSLIDTADSALGETTNLLLRMRELAVQSANGTMSGDDRTALNAEFNQLASEITRIDANTSWAGETLFNNTSRTFHIGTGNNDADKISITIGNMDADFTGSTHIIAKIDHDSNGDTAAVAPEIDTATKAQLTIAELDTAIQTVATQRGNLGAMSNRLSSTISNLDQIGVNLEASRGRIQDADFAAETSNLAKNQILQQAATAMLAQANASQGSILTLIRN